MIRAIAVTLVLAASASPALEPSPLAASPAPRVIAVGAFEDLPNGDTGMLASLDAIIAGNGGRTWLGGLERRAVGDFAWTLAKLGLVQRLGTRWHVNASLDIGPGNDERGDAFLFSSLAAGGGVRLSRHFHTDVAYSFLRADMSENHALKGGLTWLPYPRWSSRLDASHSIAGNLATRSVGLRSDLELGRFRLTGGGGLGWSRSELGSGPIALRPDTERYEQIYAGTTLRTTSVDAGLWIEQLWVAGTQRTTARVVVELRLPSLRGSGK